MLPAIKGGTAAARAACMRQPPPLPLLILLPCLPGMALGKSQRAGGPSSLSCPVPPLLELPTENPFPSPVSSLGTWLPPPRDSQPAGLSRAFLGCCAA